MAYDQLGTSGFTGDTDGFAEPLLNVEAIDPAAPTPTSPPAPEPAVNLSLSSDKKTYNPLSGDAAVILSVVLEDENGESISGLMTNDFDALMSGVSITVNFQETSTPGTYQGTVDISNYGDGTYSVDVGATDSRSISGNAAIWFAIGSTEPATEINATIDADRASYDFSNGETTAKLSVMVYDESGNGIPDLGESSFDLLLDGNPVSEKLTGTFVQGNYIASVDLTGLSGGTHIFQLNVKDSNGLSASTSTNFEVVTSTPPPPIPPAPTEVSLHIASIVYSTEGGRNKNKNLSIYFVVHDESGQPVSGATVSIDLYHNDSLTGSGSGTTGSDGKIKFNLKNVKSGDYKVTVKNLSKSGYVWDATADASDPGFTK